MKIAVCVSGQLRSYADCAPTLLSNFCPNSELDLFVHVWDRLGCTTKLELLSPPGFLKPLPIGFWHDLSTQDKERKDGILSTPPYQKVFPSLYDKAVTTLSVDNVISIDDIKKVYEPKKAIVEPFNSEFFLDIDRSIVSLQKPNENEFTSAGKTVYPQLYKINQCDLLRKSFELENSFKYDLVVRIRPDLLFRSEFFLPLHDNNSGTIYSLYNPAYENLPGILNIFANDMMFWGSSEDMSRVCDIWNHLQDLSTNVWGAEPALRYFIEKTCNLNHKFYGEKVLRPERYEKRISLDEASALVYKDLVNDPSILSASRICLSSAYTHHVMHAYATYGDCNAIPLAAETLQIFDKIEVMPPYIAYAQIASDKNDWDEASNYLKQAVDCGQTVFFPEIVKTIDELVSAHSV